MITINDEKLEMPVLRLDVSGPLFLCQPHAFILAMPPISADRGIIDLTTRRAKAKRHTWLTSGVVIAAGEHTGLRPLDHALVSPKFAKRVKGIQSGRWWIPFDVWMFGVTSPHVRDSQVMKPEQTVYGVVGRQEEYAPDWDWNYYAKHILNEALWKDSSRRECNRRIVDFTHRRNGRVEIEGRVLLKLREKWEKSPTGIVLPDRMYDRPDVAQVLAVSPLCRFAQPDDWVLYQRRAIDAMYPEDNRSEAYMPERGIFAKCLPPCE